MTAFVPNRSDKWRALGALAGALALLAAVLFVPLLRPWWQVESRLRELRAKIEATQAVLARSQEIDDALNAAHTEALRRGGYLAETTTALGSAALTLRLQEAVAAAVTEDSQCVLGNRTPIEGKRDALCSEVRIRADLQCGVASLEQVLRHLETQAPALRIDRLEATLAPSTYGLDSPVTENLPIKLGIEASACLLPPQFANGDLPAGGAP